jgi:hypothetical protein
MCQEFSRALYVEACENNTEAEIDQLGSYRLLALQDEPLLK